MNVTGNTWTFLAIQKIGIRYTCKPIERKDKKDFSNLQVQLSKQM